MTFLTLPKGAFYNFTKGMHPADLSSHGLSPFTSKKEEYPRCNILSYSPNLFRIELAVPGWSKHDIDITIKDDILSIEGKWAQAVEEDVFYLHKGLSYKDFKKDFNIASSMRVLGASMRRGFLCIELENTEPLPEKPRQIVIK